jgi:hypothetical protein
LDRAPHFRLSGRRTKLLAIAITRLIPELSGWESFARLVP